MGVLVCPVEFIFLKDGVKSVLVLELGPFTTFWLVLVFNV